MLTLLAAVALLTGSAAPHAPIVRESLTGTHVQVRELIDGVPVLGSERWENSDAVGAAGLAPPNEHP
ncbi:MAG TPA: hypothetical protein VFN10_17790, partial [Thermoanaerobaculia bacterium]|nr:hypothetical protein [Thermoanaerobaculia bacterium]